MKKNFIRMILHLLYPTRCPICGCFIDMNDDFCCKCKDKINLYTDTFNVNGSVGFIAPFIYDENISPAIMLLKDGICGNSAYALGMAVANKIIIEKINFDVIIPVPMFKSDIRKRGYNQSKLIAKEVSERINVPVCDKAVIKNRKTLPQKSLSRAERLNNLNGAFVITDHKYILRKNILLLDDVCTTGSTLAEITKLLLENGAATVFCCSCCKTPTLKENV